MSLPSQSRRLAILLAALPLVARAEVIAYNFTETDANDSQVLDETTPKGPLGTTVWNDSYERESGSVAAGFEPGLVDGSGTVTTASISWTSANTWYGDGGTDSQQQRLVVGYLDDGDDGGGNPGLYITVDDIPYPSYSAYLVVASDHGDNTTFPLLDFLINDTRWALGGDAPAEATAYASMEPTSADGGWSRILPGGQPGNYLKIENLSGPSLTIDGQHGINNVARGSVAAIIIEESVDSEPDGMADDWELAEGLQVGVNDAGDDDDEDGLTNLQEFEAATDPHDSDSDDDGLSDGDEVLIHFSNPVIADTDGDGLDDGDEVNLHGSSPILADSDDDGLPDPWEVQYGLDPADGELANGDFGDPDSDFLDNFTEYLVGTDPTDDDTDGDGLKDGDEYDIHYSDPLLTDSDGDGLPDGEEVNTHGTDPGLFDSDDDGLDDGWEVTHVLDPNDNGDVDPVNGATGDPDEDDLDNFTEYLLGTNPRSGDSDTDGLTDGDEVLVHGTDPSLPDTDGDTLSDNDELTVHGTDPTQADSDGDGATDGDEIATGHEPGDPDDFPEFTTAVTWTSERELAGASDISLNGTQVAAYVFGPSDVEVALGSETIHFEHQGGNQGAFYTANGDSTGNPSLDLLLDNHSATAGQTPWRYQLAGLVPGQTYQIQIIAGADRRLATSFRRQRFGDGLGNLTGDLTRSGPGTAVGTFTAGELGKQVIDVLPGSGDPTAETTDPALTAIIVREVDASPVRVLSFSSGADDSELSISWISEPGTSYDVQSSPDLLDWSATVNESPVVATDTTSSLTFLKPASGQLFFRVVEK